MVRMWNINPTIMCRQHLLGEHVEMHMVVGSINRGKSVDGYTSNGLLNTTLIQSRHSHLVDEMKRRGYKHHSPLNYQDTLGEGFVNEKENLIELHNRCSKCRRFNEKDNR